MIRDSNFINLDKPYRIKVGAVSRPTANVVQHLQKTTEQDKLEALLNLVSQEQEMSERCVSCALWASRRNFKERSGPGARKSFVPLFSRRILNNVTSQGKC